MSCSSADNTETGDEQAVFTEVAVLALSANGVTESTVFNFNSLATGLVLRARPKGAELPSQLCAVIDSVSTFEGQAWVGQYADDGNAYAGGMQRSSLLAGESVLVLPNHGADLMATKALSARVVVRNCSDGSIPSEGLPEAMQLEVRWLERPQGTTPLQVTVGVALSETVLSDFLSSINAIFKPANIRFDVASSDNGAVQLIPTDCDSGHQPARIPGGLTHSTLSNQVGVCLDSSTNESSVRHAAHQLGHFLGLFDVGDDALLDTVDDASNLMVETGSGNSLTPSQIHVMRTHPLARVTPVQ
mgnify:CR=1 FL=1